MHEYSYEYTALDYIFVGIELGGGRTIRHWSLQRGPSSLRSFVMTYSRSQDEWGDERGKGDEPRRLARHVPGVSEHV